MNPQRWRALESSGRLTALNGTTFQARLPLLALGDMCTAYARDGRPVMAQVVGCSTEYATLSPLERAEGLTVGSLVLSALAPPKIKPGDHLLGRIVNAWGDTLSKQHTPSNALSFELQARSTRARPTTTVMAAPPPITERAPIREQFVTGIRPIDLLTPLGIGQRLGIFASAGLGKSTLLHQLARAHSADVTVIALIGERGREVPDFLEAFSETERAKSCVAVVATADEPPLTRYLAALTATTIAEHFRDRGRSVLLIVDSLTRVARALREIGISAGELPVRQGYPNSVYLKLPALLERAGRTRRGAITGLYTVLTNTDGDLDPLADEIKSLLDGHLVLSSAEAERGIRPAIDYLASISRVEATVASDTQRSEARTVRRALARLRREKEMVGMGMTPDDELQRILACEPLMTAFLSNQLDLGALGRELGAISTGA